MDNDTKDTALAEIDNDTKKTTALAEMIAARSELNCSRAGPLRRAEFVRNIYMHVLPSGTEWRAALEPKYWGPALYKFQTGDRIEVRTEDCRVQFEIVIFSVNERVTPVLFDIGFRPIWPADLDLPAPVFRESQYKIAQSGMSWQLFDRTGRAIGSYPTRRDAGDAMALLEREALAAAAKLADKAA